jgi:Domain of unknown function (DUF4157)
MASHAAQTTGAVPSKAATSAGPARAAEQPKPERTTMPPLASAVPLAGDLRRYFTPRLGGLGNVTVATADPAVAAAGAKAVTLGQRIAFAPGRYRPDTEAGRTLIAHELIHTRQQNSGAPDRGRAAEREAAALAPELAAGSSVAPQVATGFAPAADAEDYQVSMPEEDMQAQIAALGPSKLQSDIDAINEFLDRQTQSSPETAEMEARRDQLQVRLNGLVKAAHTDPPKPKRGKAKPKGKTKNASEPVYAAPTSADAPRILREQSSMPTTDPDAVKQEVDRIIMWLQRPDVSPGDKSILRGELQTLAPQFEEARQQDSAKRQGARLQATFSSGGDGGADDLRANIAKIVGISTDPSEPGAAFIYDKGERVRISVAQAAELRANAAAKMHDTLARAKNTVEMAWGLYRAQSDVDAEYPVVSAISAWLGGVDDPSSAMAGANQQMIIASVAAKGALAQGNLLAAVDPLVIAATQARRMQMAVHAWQNGLISGAESAVAGLTFVRDCSAAIVIAIGAVVAAPFVAGAVAGAGITGVGASVLTIGGTGVVVGTGAGATFGGAEVAGQLYAGADLDQALGEGKKVFKQRFGEGLAAGVGGGTTRVVGQALGPASTTMGRYGTQLLTQGSGNFSGTVTGSLYQGDDLGTAVTKGGRSAALGTISTTAGAPFAKTPGLQTAISAGTGSVVNFHDAKAQGATDEEAWRGVAIGLTTTLATSRSTRIQKDQKRYEQKGQKFGRDMKAGTIELKNQAAEFVRPLTQSLTMPNMAMAGPGGLTMPGAMMMAANGPKAPKASGGGAGGSAKGSASTSKPTSQAKPKAQAKKAPADEVDAAFKKLEAGKLKDEQGAMLSDLMFHADRRAAMEQLRQQVDPTLRTRPGKTPDGVAVNPAPGYQSAHSSPQAALRNQPQYDPGAMITRFLPTGRGHQHTVFDQHWQAACRALIQSGRTTMTAGELHQIVSQAATNSGAFTPAVGRSVAALVYNDLFFQMNLPSTFVLRIPGS